LFIPDLGKGVAVLGFGSPERTRQFAVKNWRIVQDRADWNKDMATMVKVYRKLLAVK